MTTPLSNQPAQSREQMLTWKARLQLRLHEIRVSPPMKFLERVVWWIVG